MNTVKLDSRHYLTEDGQRLVKEGDPAAYSLLYRAGEEIPQDEAEKWGLLPEPEAVKLDTPPATKVLRPESKEAPKGAK